MAKSRDRLREIIRAKQSEIAQEWLNCILDSYPEDSAKFMRGQKNQFTNPVGHIFKTASQKAFSELVFSDSNDGLEAALDEIVRIRAVQDFSPASALAFVFDLKGIIRAYLLKDIEKEGLLEELWHLDARVDEAALIAFNIYSSCRAEIAELRVNEVKSNVYMLLRKAKLLVEEPPSSGEGAIT